MRLLAPAMLAPALLSAGLLAAASLAAGPRGAPAATPAGPPRDCLPILNIRETRVRDDRTIDFYTSDGRIYRNTLPHSCPELGFEEAFSYETSLSRLCSVDIITVLRQASPIYRGASCGLGPFQPVTIAGRAPR